MTFGIKHLFMTLRLYRLLGNVIVDLPFIHWWSDTQNRKSILKENNKCRPAIVNMNRMTDSK